MLYVPVYEPVRVMGIDPGTDTYGTCCIEIDASNNKHVIMAETVSAFKLLRQNGVYQTIAFFQNNRYARLCALVEYTVETIQRYSPHRIAYETPFLKSRFKSSFGPLVECQTMILNGIAQRYPFLPLINISPQEGKAAVSVTGKGSQKENVQRGVISRKDVTIHVNQSELDEHSWDSISVALAAIDAMEGLI